MPARHVANASRRGPGGRSPGFPLSRGARGASPYFLSFCASRLARGLGSGKVLAIVAARTPTATKVKCVPAECVALTLDGTVACRTAHSAVLRMATARSAQLGLRQMAKISISDAGKHVIARRSTEPGTIAMRSTMRVLIATTTTNACRTAAKEIIAAVTPQWLRAAAFAHGATEHALA